MPQEPREPNAVEIFLEQAASTPFGEAVFSQLFPSFQQRKRLATAAANGFAVAKKKTGVPVGE